MPTPFFRPLRGEVVGFWVGVGVGLAVWLGLAEALGVALAVDDDATCEA
ncbi:MAG: hypothetical protein WCF04_01400 [Candidatus Nanopelagicales bacterium]